MKNKDTAVFEKAFNELETEGFFRDFAAKANRQQIKTRSDTKKGRKGTTVSIWHAMVKNGNNLHSVPETLLLRSWRKNAPDTVFVRAEKTNVPDVILARVGRKKRKSISRRREERRQADGAQNYN